MSMERPLGCVGQPSRIEGESTAVGWFGDVPSKVDVAGVRLWSAQEAVEHQLEPGTLLVEDRGERPARDWAATTMLKLARFQLDQLVEVLGSEFGMNAAAFAGAEVSRRLGDLVQRPSGDVERHDHDTAIAMVGEAVDLWRALQVWDGRPVGHSFAVDGTIDFTSGPELPELSEMGIRASYGAELNCSPMTVLHSASKCTQAAAWLAARRRRDISDATRVQPVEPDRGVVVALVDVGERGWLDDLRAAAAQHFSIWSMGSESDLLSWMADLLKRAGLLTGETELDRARSSARLMSLWAIHLELAAHAGEGSSGDWRYEAVAWIDDGISSEQLLLLNSTDELGLPEDDDEWEIPASERCASVVEHYYRDVADALEKELGDSWTFAYLWASRYSDTTYPLSDDLLNDILNDPSAMFDDPDGKLPAFSWVQAGMWL